MAAHLSATLGRLGTAIQKATWGRLWTTGVSPLESRLPFHADAVVNEAYRAVGVFEEVYEADSITDESLKVGM